MDSSDGSNRNPVVTCEPPRGLLRVNWAELWKYRELWLTFAARDITVRYKQTLLGALWAILQPLAAMAVFTVVFSYLAELSTDGNPPQVFYYAGLLPWTFFAATVTGASQSLIEGSRLITKVYFPRVLIPSSVLGYALVDLALAALLLLPLSLVYRVYPTWSILLLPAVLLGLILTSLGAGMLLAALNVKYRDFRYIVPFLLQIWFFCTPVIYPVSLLRDKLAGAWWINLNPMVGMVVAFRRCLAGQPIDGYGLAVSTGVGAVLFVVGLAYFRRVEDRFADIV